jgi:hypothetical protein
MPVFNGVTTEACGRADVKTATPGIDSARTTSRTHHTVRMPSGHVESFRSHANYLRAFSMLCTTPYQEGVTLLFIPLQSQLAALAPAVVALPSMTPPPTAQPDLAQTRTSLVNAWGTELLLALGGQLATEEELLRLMNNWAAVQAYYVGYHAVQALICARGQPRPDTHPKTQAQFATLWTDRTLHLPPWTLGARDGGWCNAPSHIDDNLNPWSSCDPVSAWSLAAKALRTTRDDVVRDRLAVARDQKRAANRKHWREDEQRRVAAGKRARKEPSWPRPHLTVGEKRTVHRRVRSYTMLDYLYRLRIKTNYEDAGMFIEGPEDQLSSRHVHNDLVAISGCTLLVHELHIASIVGRERLLQWVDAWLGPHAKGQSLGLALRRDLIAKFAPS